MKHLFSLKKISAFWFVSYLLILVIPITVNLLVYMRLDSIMVEQTNNYNMVVLQNAGNSIDSMIDKIINAGVEISIKKNVIEAANYKYPLSSEEKFQIRQMINEWNVYKLLDLGVKDIIVYYPYADYLVYSGGIAKADAYYNLQNIGGSGEYKKWYDLITGNEAQGLISNDRGGGSRTVYYKYNPIIPNLFNSSPSILIELDPNIFLPSGVADTGQLFLIDKDSKEVILGNADGRLLSQIEWTNRGSGIQKSENRTYIISWLTLKSLPCNIVYATDERGYMSGVNSIRNLVAVSTVICFVLEILMIIFFVKRNNKPIVNLVEKLYRFNPAVDKSLNEYQYIDMVVMDALNKKEEYFDKLYKQEKAVAENILGKLVKGRLSGERNFEELISSVGIKFPYDNFIALIFYIDNVKGLFFEDGANSDERFEQARYVISNITEEMLNRYFKAYFFECDNMQVCLVNCPENSQDEKNKLKDIVVEAGEFILANFNFEFVSAVSDIHSTLRGVPLCYEEAYDALEYKFVWITDSILDYSNIDKDVKDEYYYSLEKESRIMNYLKSGECDKCISVLDEIFAMNFDDRKISLQLTKFLMFDIASTLIKVMNEMSVDSQHEMLNYAEIYDTLASCETVVEMKQRMYDIFGEICGYIKSNVNTGSKLISSVVSYINENYRDDGLNVAVVSQHFGVNPDYLSYTFKKNMEQGLLGYITNLRIDMAKLMIQEGDVTIETIAKEVGFSNYRTFHRVFTKYTGVSPRKFRE